MTIYQLFAENDDAVIITFESNEYVAQQIVDTYTKASNYEIVYELEEN